jgi:hypothetical protein
MGYYGKQWHWYDFFQKIFFSNKNMVGSIDMILH